MLPQWPEGVNPPISMPVRPPWSYSDTKQQLEERERRAFDEWCRKLNVSRRPGTLPCARRANSPRSLPARIRIAGKAATRDQLAQIDSRATAPPTQEEHPPGSLNRFERNLEVWRQLWRTTEVSDVVLCVVRPSLPGAACFLRVSLSALTSAASAVVLFFPPAAAPPR